MPRDVFRNRARALEDAFFHRVDQDLVVRLSEQHQQECDEDALAMASGIVDRKLLDQLLALGITPRTLAAFSLFPAVYVAWANGFVERVEREAVLQAAVQQGISAACPAHQLLESWLKRPPTPELLAAWKDFIHAIRPTVSVSAFHELRDMAMKRAHKIAEAAGGFLKVMRVSAAEKLALKELEDVFVDAANSEEAAASN